MPINSEHSPQMDLLYGNERANVVWQRLESIDAELNKEIQQIAYDHYWARPGLSLKEKSLVTVMSLITFNKEEQTRIHLHGLIHLGATLFELAFLMIHLRSKISAASAEKAVQSCLDVLIERQYTENDIEQFKNLLTAESYTITIREKGIIDTALAAAAGNNSMTKDAVKAALDNGLSVDDLKSIFIHQIVYCGFPTAMNAFVALQEVLRNFSFHQNP